MFLNLAGLHAQGCRFEDNVAEGTGGAVMVRERGHAVLCYWDSTCQCLR